MSTLVNGLVASTISVADRGLQYGDGLFEPIAWRNGVLEYWDAHIQRLTLGCHRLGISLPDITTIKEECLLVTGSQATAVIKIILTRGEGGRGYKPDDHTRPTRIISSHSWPEDVDKYARQGIACTLCKSRLAMNPLLAGLKHLNRLEQVLAARELDGGRFQEGLLLDYDNNLICGTKSNLFLVRNNVLYTADLRRTGIAGVMRANILAIAQSLDLPVNIQDLTIDDLHTAEEVFLSNSIIGLWPVRSIDDRHYNSNTWTQKIQKAI